MFLIELHTEEQCPDTYAGVPVRRPAPGVVEVDVDAPRLSEAIDLALGWAEHHGASVGAVTIRGSTLAAQRRPSRRRRQRVAGDGWVEIFRAVRCVVLDRDEQLRLWELADAAEVDGRLVFGEHPDHHGPVVRIDDLRRVWAEGPRPESHDDLVSAHDAVRRFGARRLDDAIATGLLEITHAADGDARWFRAGDLDRFR